MMERLSDAVTDAPRLPAPGQNASFDENKGSFLVIHHSRSL